MFSGICTYSGLLDMFSKSKLLKSLGYSIADAEAVLRFWLNTGLIQQTDAEAQSIGFRHQAFQYFGAALALTYQSEKVVAEILADVGKGWDDVKRLYLGLIAHPQSPLE